MSRYRLTIATAGILGVGVLGVIGITGAWAHTQTGDMGSDNRSAALQSTGHSIRLASSSPAPAPVMAKQEAVEKENDGEKEDEGEANLTASITTDQAKSAALAAQPGTAGKVDLEDEDGKAVYGVDITGTDGKKYDVKVDGASGKVLKSEADDEGEEQGGETEKED